MKRKTISKKLRQNVFEKYKGHCAYCGKEIDIKDMQVDHAIAYAQSVYGRDWERVSEMIFDNTINDFDNLMPSCRQCNFYKGIRDIEQFRARIKNELEHTCRQTFQTRLAIQFGMIEYHEWDGKFYYEKTTNK